MLALVVADLAPGTLAGWLTFAALAALVVMLARGGIPGAVGEMRAANQVLTSRLHNLNDEKRELEREVAELRGRTDVAIALEPLARSIEHHDERMANLAAEHDRRADERHLSILGVLDLIAQRLGPDDAANAP